MVMSDCHFTVQFNHFIPGFLSYSVATSRYVSEVTIGYIPSSTPPRFMGVLKKPPRVRSHRRFRNRGTEYVSESGMKWMSGRTKRHCGRALHTAAATGLLRPPTGATAGRPRRAHPPVRRPQGARRGLHHEPLPVCRRRGIGALLVVAVVQEAGPPSPGRHCHSALPLTVIACHYLGIYTLILLSLLSFSVKMAVSPPARPTSRARGGSRRG
jgi:hypothetical protein